MADADDLRRQLRHLVADDDDDLTGLVSEARREAQARVRSLLADAFTDVLLERVSDVLEPLVKPADQPEGPTAPPTAAAPPTPAPPPTAAPPTTRPMPPSADAPPASAATPSPSSAATPSLSSAATPSPSSATPPAPDSEPASGELGWYVYCVVDGEHEPLREDLAGIDPHHPVLTLPEGDVGAIVSRVALADFGEQPLREHLSDMDWLERTARRHEEMLEEVARGGTPIPMRLCSIYRDEAGVRDMLAREGDALREALAYLRGKAEWGVKAFADLDGVESPAGDEAAPRAGDGAAYMQNRLSQRRRREEAQARIEEACDALHAALCDIATDGIISPPQRPEVTGRDVPMIFNGSYLVADADVDRFHRELRRFADELAPQGIELEPTGPWPPYNFVPGAIGAAW